MSIDLIDKKKIKADDYISVLIAANYVAFALFYHLEALISIIVYPFVALAMYGVIKIINFLNKKNSREESPIKFFFGIVAIIVSILFLWFMLMQPNFTAQVLMNLIAFPMIIVGFAGIIKGYIIDIYSRRHRTMTIIVGIITILLCLSIFLNIFNNLIFSIVALSVILVLNVLSRAALYLSEFGLSIVHIKNFKIFLYIISDYLIYVDRDGNLVLSKL
ncbi:MAG: DUF308 domain-containing protein [Candidatus Hermodarchaeota archaeon]